MNTSISNTLKTPRSLLILALFLVVTVGAGSFIGASNIPDAWFQALEKPFFQPPNWVFAPAWLTLYVLIAIAGWRIFMLHPKSAVMGAWIVQMLLNWAWSPTFFTMHNIWLALGIILALWLVIIYFIRTAAYLDRPSAWLFVPYLAWVTFATMLNGAIAFMN